MNKIFEQLLAVRHITDDFLHPKYESLTDPFALPDMPKAIDRLTVALKNHEKILIYGDYDVDGVTASALMDDVLRLAGATNLEIMLPDRFIDGYGMSPRLVERAKKEGITLVITVDCGSRNHEIISELRAANIDTIVTDHHECAATLPQAVAVVNPKRPDFTGPATLRNLAGVGVAFNVASALARRGLIPAGQEKWLLDLVLLGTICDSMMLTGDNRILCHYGALVLAKTRRPGLRELLRCAKVTVLNSEAIGFQLGPRLNAAGRLDTATLSLELLRTRSGARAATLAKQLDTLNAKRRKEQRAATDAIAARRATITAPDPVIVETGPWHEGILGIVAGRLVENYHRPAFVLAEVEDNVLKGSGRSFGDFSLAEALQYASDFILGGGGHAAAAGVRLSRENLPAFTAKINEFYRSLHLADQERFLKSQADLTISALGDLSLELLDNLRLLEPFGQGNTEPVLRVTGSTIAETRRMGADGRHLRLDLRGSDGRIVKCVAFSAPEAWFGLNPDTPYDFLIRPVENEWHGTRSAEARLLDVLPV